MATTCIGMAPSHPTDERYRYRTDKVNPASCITRNVLQTRSLPHLGMSSKASPSNRVRSGREEGCGGAIHGRAQGGDQADGKALQQGRQGREGQDARRTMRPHRLDSPALPAGAHRGPPSAGAPHSRPRARTYGPEVVEPLKLVWATLNGPAGKRLQPFMAEAVDALERHGELSVA